MTEVSQSGTAPRKLTAVGTVGAMGQLFSVYERNWHCKDCHQENYPTRHRCFRCKRKRPQGEHDYVPDPALEAARSGVQIAWQEVIDPASHQIYYYNKETGATQWERPAEMGAAPMATGWFGRGQAGSTAAQQYAERNAKLLARPARKQKDFIDPKKYHTEGHNEYNIWYDKYFGDTPDKSALKDPAADRCSIEKDGGLTKADGGGAQRKERRYFCLHFARGMCAKGADCTYYHRTPLPDDDARCDELFDCFGRSRHSSHRDDMNGVGSFMKPSRTLFVGNLQRSQYKTPKDLEDATWKHFGEWGELENVNVIHRLSIAFPRYRLRTSAEFAKEAMTCQTLDHGEVLSIRWARDDPNPLAQEAISKADKDALAALFQAKGISVEAAPFDYPTDYQIPASKKMRLDDGTEVTTDKPELAYPDTDEQYDRQAAAAAAATAAAGYVVGEQKLTAEEYAAYCEAYYADYYANQAQPTASTSAPTSSKTSDNAAVTAAAATTGSKQEVAASSEGDAFFSQQKASLLSAFVGLDEQQGPPASPTLADVLPPVPPTAAQGAMMSAVAAAAAVVAAAAAAQGKSVAAVDEDEEDNGEEESDEEEDREEEEDGLPAWTEHIDPDTGATYYFNRSTGQSSWGTAPPSSDNNDDDADQ